MDFLKKQRRWDFLYDGRSVWETDAVYGQTVSGNTAVSTLTVEGTLRVTNRAKKYERFGAYEWVSTFENIGTRPTGLITELFDAAYSFAVTDPPAVRKAYIPPKESEVIMNAPFGSNLSVKEFYVNTDHLEKYFPCRYHLGEGMSYEYNAFGGRSSDTRAPFFHLRQGSRGVIFAIGWTGQWRLLLRRENGEVVWRSGIEDAAFRLYPGEEIRTSSILIMPYEGDAQTAQNRFRRLIKEELSPIGKEGRDAFAPFSVQIWGGMSSEMMIERAKAVKANGIPAEYFWIDAGWYGMYREKCIDEFEGSWGSYTGDWRVNPVAHPRGLADVVQTVESLGMKMLLWVEPERVMYDTPAACEHPEYFLGPTKAGDQHRLLNLGDPDAWQYCFDTLSELIERLHVSCYRQDFNAFPLETWRQNDRADRKGLTEIRYITGLYRLWDALLARFPHLIIDNCASGGKRIDIETLRRSVPLWRSDRMCQANCPEMVTQTHGMTFGTWMPYSGTTTGRHFDPYRFRSAYAPAMTLGYTYTEYTPFAEDETEIREIRRYCEEYLRVRPYLSEDIYPLTVPSDSEDVWSAVQYHRASKGDGIVQIFRREASPYECACFRLGGLDAGTTYVFADADTGETWELDGGVLLEKGMPVTVSEPRTAKLLFYRVKTET
ncbi:MAG: alpha-galactosidase [Clostridia bacterium]|nr:alpha-galactosidase [Clostridia bacterium]